MEPAISFCLISGISTRMDCTSANVRSISPVLYHDCFVEIPEIKQKEIAVITPWREQVWKMRAALRTAGYGGVDVGNVEVSDVSSLVC
jgi:superfamily I DNA and/or RNA helicase